MKYGIPTSISNLSSILVPTSTGLSHMNVTSIKAAQPESSQGLMFIRSIDENVDVSQTKAKPKIIVIHTICGKKIKFLVKQEKSGDLRKDARMMDFNSIVNRLFASSHESMFLDFVFFYRVYKTL